MANDQALNIYPWSTYHDEFALSFRQNLDRKCYRGLIVAISWDYFDNPKEYALFRDDADELILRPLAKKLDLQPYVNKEVVVCGYRKGAIVLAYQDIKLAPMKNLKKDPPVEELAEYSLNISKAWQQQFLQ